MVEELRLGLLGGFRASYGSGPLFALRSSKARALLSYLLVTGHAQSRHALAGLLWGDLPEKAAAANLRVTLGALNSVVSSHLVITRQTIAFNRQAPYWLDVEVLNSAVTASASTGRIPNVPALESALRLYEGEFLEGLYVHQASAFEEWVWGQREHLRCQALQGLHTLIEYYKARGHYSEAIRYCTRLLELEPWQEEMHRQMMLLFVLDGQVGAALAHYTTCRQILRRELGAEPSPVTTALYEQIRRRGEEEHAQLDRMALHIATRANNLPYDVTPFVGRQRELAQITGHLTDPSCRLLTISGPQGSGKTRLAVHAAGEQFQAFFHGVWFARLAGVVTAEEMARVLLQALHLPENPGIAPQHRLVTHLSDKQMLLVLDHLESPVGLLPLLQTLLASAPGVKFLVTTHSRLGMPAEWPMAIGGLPYPEDRKAGAADAYAALQLLASRSARFQVQPPVPSPGDPALARLAQLLGGLPLSLELAAGAAGVEGWQTLVEEIERRLGDAPAGDADRARRALKALLDYWWPRLAPEERDALERIAVPGKEIEAAQASPQTLATLAGKYLLREAPAGHYTMHEAVRAYITERLHKPQQAPIVASAAGESSRAAELVGRREEAQYLWTAWERAAKGQAGLMLLSGPPGIGKTRLAENLLEHVQMLGVPVARARAYRPLAGSKSQTYGPIAEWLREPALETSRQRLGPTGTATLSRLLPDAAEQGAVDPVDLLEESQHRDRLLNLLARGLAGDGQPALIFLDDLHWSDTGTLSWLLDLLRSRPHAPLLVLATASYEEAGSQSWIEFVSEVDRNGLLTTIVVPPLDALATATLACRAAKRQLDEEAQAAIYRASEGNPLFAQEIARQWMASDVAHLQLSGPSPAFLPKPARAALKAWLRGLSPEANELLQLATVLGRAFRYGLVRAIQGIDDETQVRALEELCRRGIVRELDDDEYELSHGLLRKEVYGSLIAARRRALEERIDRARQPATTVVPGAGDGIIVWP